MENFFKAIELFLKQDFFVCAISLLVTFLASFIIKDYSITLGIIVFLLSFLILYWIKRVVKTLIMKYKKSYYSNQINERQIEENIENFRNFFDKISDEEYSILMFLINNKNQLPIIRWENQFSNVKSNLFNYENKNKLFYCTEVNKIAPSSEVTMSNGEKKMMNICGQGYQYILKDEIYNFFSEILVRKGSLSHLKREIIDINNFDDVEVVTNE